MYRIYALYGFVIKYCEQGARGVSQANGGLACAPFKFKVSFIKVVPKLMHPIHLNNVQTKPISRSLVRPRGWEFGDLVGGPPPPRTRVSPYAHGRPELGVSRQLRMHERGWREPCHVHATIEGTQALQRKPDQGRA